MISSKKKEEYEKYLTQFNHKGSLELANCFYVAYATGYANACEDSYSASESEQRLTIYRDAYLNLRSVVSEVCLYKIYDDYEFKFEQMSSYYTNPVVFPLAEFEKTTKRARQAIKEADEIMKGIK